ncbi:hypothetical protein BRADI_2g19405v3 [Brachypodium distachyon]|uniref:Uncharacterized protein n=1 Tax=Brachypodium distachyon TaxID=15368 RepID=A0A0Q3G1P8_BRADI|nr:hypothetical protein BRADI_2g19405v3 [Brachypodium distachyon]
MASPLGRLESRAARVALIFLGPPGGPHAYNAVVHSAPTAGVASMKKQCDEKGSIPKYLLHLTGGDQCPLPCVHTAAAQVPSGRERAPTPPTRVAGVILSDRCAVWKPETTSR